MAYRCSSSACKLHCCMAARSWCLCKSSAVCADRGASPNASHLRQERSGRICPAVTQCHRCWLPKAQRQDPTARSPACRWRRRRQLPRALYRRPTGDSAGLRCPRQGQQRAPRLAAAWLLNTLPLAAASRRTLGRFECSTESELGTQPNISRRHHACKVDGPACTGVLIRLQRLTTWLPIKTHGCEGVRICMHLCNHAARLLTAVQQPGGRHHM